MMDPKTPTPALTPPGPRTTMRRPLRSTSQSPSRHRLGDELLSHLSPTSAVDALKTPSGALKACLDNASAFEQSFAMRTAVASQMIHEWLDELSDWPWPAAGGSAGFEMPAAKRRKVSDPLETPKRFRPRRVQDSSPQPETDYLGSLPAENVALYEQRVEQIHRGMDDLDLEEIKSHVLHNHIMPLSRPGTPSFSDGGRSVTSAASFAKLEDLAAVITAITIQALPNLSRLSRLLNVWTVRLTLLRKVPSLLMMITDAEVALKAGWSAIDVEGNATKTTTGDQGSKPGETFDLSRADFEVMQSVLQQKVALPGRDLDYMLDALEGMEDTLPDKWLDRMQETEEDYAKWVATAERQVRAGEWSQMYGATREVVSPRMPETPRPKIQIQRPSPSQDEFEDSEIGVLSSPPDASDLSSRASDIKNGGRVGIRAPSKEEQPGSARHTGTPELLVGEANGHGKESMSKPLNLSDNTAHQHGVGSGTIPTSPNLDNDEIDDGIPSTPIRHSKRDASEDEFTTPGPASRVSRPYDGSDDQPQYEVDRPRDILSEVDRDNIRLLPDLDSEYSVLESVNEEDEDEEDQPELPPARFDSRRGSHATIDSMVMQETMSDFGHSDNAPYREDSLEPELPRLPDPDEPLSSDAMSPPSSPPSRFKPRSTSVTFNDLPEIAPTPEVDVTPPRSPLGPPEVFETDTSFEYGSQLDSPSRMSVASEDDLLHQQISEVLQSLPTKIRLTTRASAINLNPPDLVLPTRPKPKNTDPFRRSGSALSTMSSRASTPSWLLAPVKNTRPRSRNSQEAKAYYLSRSTGEAPIKLLIRCVGENGERVMVRVGGGWADLGEYLKEYATHHGRRSKGEGKVEVKDLPAVAARSNSRMGSSPPSRPASAMDNPMTPLAIRKTRKSMGEEGSSRMPKTPLAMSTQTANTPPSDGSSVSRSSSRLEWAEENSALGLSGPVPKKADKLSAESKAWVEDVKTKVRTASGERMALENMKTDGKLGELGKVGGTKRLFRRGKNQA